MRHTTRILAAGAAAATVLLASAGTATAGSDSIDDKRYDSLVTTSAGITGGTLASKGTYAQRVNGSKLDVDKMTVNHGSQFVSIRFTMHNLDSSTLVGGMVRVNGGTADDFYLDARADGSSGDIVAQSFPSESGINCGTDTPTRSIKGSSKLGKGGFVQLYVPRACFDNPKHLRFGGVSAYYGNLPAMAKNKLSSMRSLAAENEHYYDPVNSAYFGAPEFTSWLARG